MTSCDRPDSPNSKFSLDRLVCAKQRRGGGRFSPFPTVRGRLRKLEKAKEIYGRRKEHDCRHALCKYHFVLIYSRSKRSASASLSYAFFFSLFNIVRKVILLSQITNMCCILERGDISFASIFSVFFRANLWEVFRRTRVCTWPSSRARGAFLSIAITFSNPLITKRALYRTVRCIMRY